LTAGAKEVGVASRSASASTLTNSSARAFPISVWNSKDVLRCWRLSSSFWRAWNLSRLAASACKAARVAAVFVLAAEIELAREPTAIDERFLERPDDFQLAREPALLTESLGWNSFEAVAILFR